MNNDVELDDDKELEKLMLEIEKDSERIDEICSILDQNFENAELFENLLEVMVGTNTKLELLRGLQHKNITQQYLIDLFLSQSISIYEGFIHNFLMILSKNNLIIDKLDKIEPIYNNKILFKKSKRDKASNVDEAISLLLTKTLNNPSLVKRIFKIIFNYDLDKFSLLSEDSEFFKIITKSLIIRNAHMHKNGIYTEEPLSLEDVNKLLDNLMNFINILIHEFNEKQKQKFIFD